MDVSWSSLLEVMENRRSIRRFQSKPVEKHLVELLINAAVTAPSASNKQPWRFWIIENQNTKNNIAYKVRDILADIEKHIETESAFAFHSYGDYFTRFEDAPLVIVPLYRKLSLLSHLTGITLGSNEKESVELLEKDSALISTALAVQNLLLMASVLGLGASVMTGPLVARDDIRNILRIKPSWHPVALVAVGYPAEEAAKPGRKDSSQITRWI